MEVPTKTPSRAFPTSYDADSSIGSSIHNVYSWKVLNRASYSNTMASSVYVKIGRGLRSRSGDSEVEPVLSENLDRTRMPNHLVKRFHQWEWTPREKVEHALREALEEGVNPATILNDVQFIYEKSMGHHRHAATVPFQADSQIHTYDERFDYYACLETAGFDRYGWEMVRDRGGGWVKIPFADGILAECVYSRRVGQVYVVNTHQYSDIGEVAYVLVSNQIAALEAFMDDWCLDAEIVQNQELENWY